MLLISKIYFKINLNKATKTSPIVTTFTRRATQQLIFFYLQLAYLDQSGSPIPVQCIIEVTGLPDGVSEDMLTNYFENARRSKGGPVSSVVMTPELRKCLVTFESPDRKTK